MAAADPKPGRRRAEPQRRVRRARPERQRPSSERQRPSAERQRPSSERSAPGPARGQRVSRPPKAPRPAKPARERVGARITVAAAATVWAVLVLAGLAALLTAWTPLPVPSEVPLGGAVLITTGYAYALGVRSGGRPVVTGLVALVLAGAAAVSGLPLLLAGAAVSTAVLGAVLGVLATKPAVRFRQVVRECLVATLLASGAAFAAVGYDARVSPDRAGYLTLVLALAATLALAYRLGAGLQGLGTRGTIMVASGVGLLAVSLAYTEALARWGPPGLMEDIGQVTADLRSAIGAMPRPMEFLLGFPVLAWGVSTRARRRQGWWAVVFGAGGLAVVASSLLDPAVSLEEAGLSLLYSLVIGLLLGYLVIRADRFLSGARGRRARLAEEAAAHRPEPGRLRPLM